MEKIVIYGVGKRFKGWVEQGNIFRNYKIVGLIDQICGQTLTLNNERYTVVPLNQWTDFSVDRVVITPKKCQDEIKTCLLEYGFRQEQVWLLDEMIKLVLDELVHIELFKNKMGLEVGGPSAIFSNIYDICETCDGVNYCIDTVWWKQGKTEIYMYETHRLGKVFIADATDLADISDGFYDFILSSNNLEHIANPIKALGEFYRVVKKEGIIVVVVPKKYATFDHRREFTSFEHILEDYKNDIKEDDLTHLPEIIAKHDYDMDIPCGGREAFLLRAQNNFENRCLHHHVFDEKCLKSMFEFWNIYVLEFADIGNNYWIVGKK